MFETWNIYSLTNLHAVGFDAELLKDQLFHWIHLPKTNVDNVFQRKSKK